MLMIGTTGIFFLLKTFLFFFSRFELRFSSSDGAVDGKCASNGTFCPFSVWYDMLPYSCNILHNKNWLKFFRIPNHPEIMERMQLKNVIWK